PAVESTVAKSSIPWPITGPLDEPAFHEARELVRDCVAAMDRACETLTDMYRGRDVPADVQKIWDTTIERAARSRPLIDGTWTHADHLHAWAVNPAIPAARGATESTKATEPTKGMETGKKRKRAIQPKAPALTGAEEVKPLPVKVQNELCTILVRYLEHGERK